MIDLEHDLSGAKREAVHEFFRDIHRGMCITGRVSEIVRVRFVEFGLDFRVTLLGTSRPRRQRPPLMTPTSKEK